MKELMGKRRAGLAVGAAIGMLVVGGCKSTAQSSGEGAGVSSQPSISSKHFDITGTVKSKDTRSLTLDGINIIESSTGSSAGKWLQQGDTHVIHNSYQDMSGTDHIKGHAENSKGQEVGISYIHTGDIVEAKGSLTDSRKSDLSGLTEQQPVFDVVIDESR